MQRRGETVAPPTEARNGCECWARVEVLAPTRRWRAPPRGPTSGRYRGRPDAGRPSVACGVGSAGGGTRVVLGIDDYPLRDGHLEERRYREQLRGPVRPVEVLAVALVDPLPLVERREPPYRVRLPLERVFEERPVAEGVRVARPRPVAVVWGRGRADTGGEVPTGALPGPFGGGVCEERVAQRDARGGAGDVGQRRVEPLDRPAGPVRVRVRSCELDSGRRGRGPCGPS